MKCHLGGTKHRLTKFVSTGQLYSCLCSNFNVGKHLKHCVPQLLETFFYFCLLQLDGCNILCSLLFSTFMTCMENVSVLWSVLGHKRQVWQKLLTLRFGGANFAWWQYWLNFTYSYHWVHDLNHMSRSWQHQTAKNESCVFIQFLAV